MGLNVGHAHNVRPLAVEHGRVQRLGLGKHLVAANGVKRVVGAVPAMDVPMDPADVVVRHRAPFHGRVLLALHPNTPGRIVGVAGHELAVRVFFPLPTFGVRALHALADVDHVHGDDMDEVRAGVDRVGPVGRRVKPEVLDGDQVDHGLVVRPHQLALGVLAHGIAPMAVGNGRTLNLRVLKAAHGDLEPGDGLGQPVLEQLLHDVGRDTLDLVVAVHRADGNAVKVAEECRRGRRLVLADDGAGLRHKDV